MLFPQRGPKTEYILFNTAAQNIFYCAGMAVQDMPNGAGAASDLTPAQRLMEKHTAEDGHAHNVTLEEVVDEDDLEHPPPSAKQSALQAPTTSTPAEPFSDKAAGKRPEAAQPSATAKPALDTTSEELFPALGASKSHAAAAPTPWSRKPPAVAANGAVNGLANGHSAKSTASSRTSTPGLGSATSTVPSQRGAFPQMSLPGRHTEKVQFAPSQLTPRNQLKKPVQDVLRDINKRSKARIEMSTGQGGVIVFEGTGPVDAVRQALKDVAKELGSKVSRTKSVV